MSRPSFSPQQDAVILSKPRPDKFLAREWGREPRAVMDRRYVLRRRFSLPPRRRSRAFAHRERIVQLLREGKSLSQIAQHLGLTKGLVSGFVRRHRLRERRSF
jgi:DNA-binding NarL/FixJ family response regulator